jgi:hypothetical protein
LRHDELHSIANTNFVYSLFEITDKKVDYWRGEKFLIGCHIFRKAYYVLALFGYGNASDTQQCARHLTEKNASKNSKTAAALFKLTYANQLPEIQWASGNQRRLPGENGSVNDARRVQAGETYRYRCLFVHDFLKVPRSGPGATPDGEIIAATWRPLQHAPPPIQQVVTADAGPVCVGAQPQVNLNADLAVDRACIFDHEQCAAGSVFGTSALYQRHGHWRAQMAHTPVNLYADWAELPVPISWTMNNALPETCVLRCWASTKK